MANALNPSKYIRAGIIAALPNYRVFNNRIPTNTSTPSLYVLITNQSRNEYAMGKQCNEWECQFTLQVIYKGVLGNDYSAIVDDAVQVIDNAIRSMKIPNFYNKQCELDSEFDDTYDTPTNTINRKRLSYSIWVNNADI